MKLRFITSMLLIIMAITTMIGATYAISAEGNTYWSSFSSSDGSRLIITKLGDDGNYHDDISINEENICPGYKSIHTYKIKNNGESSGFLVIDKVIINNFENGISEGQETLLDKTAGEYEGELGGLLNLELYYISSGNTKSIIYGDESDKIFNGFSLDSIIFNKMPVGAGEEIEFVAEVHWPTTYSNEQDNMAQSDIATLKINLVLEEDIVPTTTGPQPPTGSTEPPTTGTSTTQVTTEPVTSTEDDTTDTTTTATTGTVSDDTTADYTEPTAAASTESATQPSIAASEPGDEFEEVDEIDVPLAESPEDGEAAAGTATNLPVTGGFQGLMIALTGILITAAGIIIKKGNKNANK